MLLKTSLDKEPKRRHLFHLFYVILLRVHNQDCQANLKIDPKWHRLKIGKRAFNAFKKKHVKNVMPDRPKSAQSLVQSTVQDVRTTIEASLIGQEPNRKEDGQLKKAHKQLKVLRTTVKPPWATGRGKRFLFAFLANKSSFDLI